MSSPEGREQDELSRGHEQEPQVYQRAARFGGEREAWHVYTEAQRLIAESEASISAYRFQLARVWHVAVVAERVPDVSLERAIDRALSAGQPAMLPAGVLRMLLGRHRQMMRSGASWFEGHYDPGERLG